MALRPVFLASTRRARGVPPVVGDPWRQRKGRELISRPLGRPSLGDWQLVCRRGTVVPGTSGYHIASALTIRGPPTQRAGSRGPTTSTDCTEGGGRCPAMETNAWPRGSVGGFHSTGFLPLGVSQMKSTPAVDVQTSEGLGTAADRPHGLRSCPFEAKERVDWGSKRGTAGYA